MITYFSTKRLVEKNKYIAMPLGVLIVILSLFVLIVKPKITEISENNRALETGQKRLDILLKKANTLSSFEKNDLQQMFNTLNSAVPTEKEVPAFLLGVERMGQEASVSVGLIEVSPGSIATVSAKVGEVKKLQTTPVVAKVTIRGIVPNIISFISKAIHSRRLLKIDGVNLSNVGAQKANEPISMVLNVSLYYQPLPQTLGDIALPVMDLTDEEERNYLTIKNYPLFSSIDQIVGSSPTVESVPSGSVPIGKTDLFSR